MANGNCMQPNYHHLIADVWMQFKTHDVSIQRRRLQSTPGCKSPRSHGSNSCIATVDFLKVFMETCHKHDLQNLHVKENMLDLHESRTICIEPFIEKSAEKLAVRQNIESQANKSWWLVQFYLQLTNIFEEKNHEAKAASTPKQTPICGLCMSLRFSRPLQAFFRHLSFNFF